MQQVTPVVPTAVQAVDTERYPLHQPGTDLWRSAVDAARAELAEDGCAVLRGFVRPEWLEALRREGTEVEPSAHYATSVVNVYNTDPNDDALPADHPARVLFERGNAFVARDQIPPEHIIQRLYGSADFRAFVAACVGAPGLYELDDPLAGLCLNVVCAGREHPWHFDTNDVAISLLTQRPERGGTFEYCPDIRSAEAENTANVAAVLAGRQAERVRRLELRPGDLQLFRGRYSLHRVTAVAGAVPRHTAIFAYSRQPGVVGNAVRTQQLFGRTLAQHENGSAVSVDELLA